MRQPCGRQSGTLGANGILLLVEHRHYGSSAIDGHLLAFLGLAAILTVTPGADMAVVTKVALAQGRAAAGYTALGIITGLMSWGLISALGLAALLTASATAFTLLKLAGAAYLLYLGLQALWAARAGAPDRAADATTPVPEGRPARGSAYRRGLLSNLLNPKVGVFYTTFLPQFIAPGQPVFTTSLALAGIHAVMGLLWLFSYAHLVAGAGDVLRRPRIKRFLDRATGAVLIAFGLRLAVAHR